MQNPKTGPQYLFYGFWLIRQKGIRRFVLIPLLINILIFCILLLVSYHYFNLFVVYVDQYLPTWLHWLTWILWVVFAIGYFLGMVVSFTFIANLIAAPFNGFLAEKVELLLTGKLAGQDDNWADVLKDAPRVIGREIRKILYYLPRAIGLLILFLIPVVNLVAGVLWFVFNAWMLYLQYIDYPADNHKVAFHELVRVNWQQRMHGLGFGCAVLLVTMIPGVNFLVMPAAVAGASAYWVEGELNYKS